MSIGFYDLYKNLPVVHNLMGDYLYDWTDWLEQMIYFRMSILIGYIVYFTGPFSAIFDYFFIGESFLWPMMYSVLSPFFYVAWLLKAFVSLIFDLLLPVLALFGLIFRAGW